MTDEGDGERPEYLRIARVQLDSVEDHCASAREDLASARDGLARGDGEAALEPLFSGSPPVAETCRAIRSNTFDTLNRQLSKLLASSPESVSDELDFQRLDECVEEMGEHHDRLMDAIGRLATRHEGGSFDADQARRDLEMALQAVDHIESTAELIRCLMEQVRLKVVEVESEPDPDPEPAPSPSTAPDEYVLAGQVTHGGDPLSGVVVRAFDRDLRGREQLGESETDPEGRYRIAYTDEAFQRAERGTADVEVEVYDAVGRSIATETGEFNVGRRATVDVAVPAGRAVEPTEYARLRHELADPLDGVAVTDLTEEDIAFLHAELGVTGRSVYPAGATTLPRLQIAARLAAESPFTERLLYGVARKIEHEFDRAWLADAEPAQLADLVTAAVDDRVIDVATEGLQSRLATDQRRLREARHIESGTETRARIRFRDGDGNPLPGYAVHVEDPEDDRKRHATQTDADGVGTFSYTHGGDPTRDVAVTVRNDVGTKLHSETVTVDGESTPTVTVPDPAPGHAGPATFRDLEVDAGSVPAAQFTETGPSTVRRAGGVESLDRGPSGGQDAAAVDGMAELDLLTTPETASALSEANFGDRATIARTSFERFRSSVEPLDTMEALRVHTKARAQTHALDSTLVERRGGVRNGLRRGHRGNGDGSGSDGEGTDGE